MEACNPLRPCPHPEYRRLGLRRRGFFLFVADRFDTQDGPEGAPSLPIGRTPEYYAGLQVRLPEYDIHEKQVSFCSRQVPIRGLDALPACGLAVEVDRDASGRVHVTLENWGLDLPGNQGVVLIYVDEGRHSGGYDLALIDQGFARGGGTDADPDQLSDRP